MKCCHCGTDSRHRDWQQSRACPKCGRRFVFFPRDGDPVSDVGFQRAIDAVSSEGRVRWGVEHLYYAVDRRYSAPLADHRAIGLLLMLSPLWLFLLAGLTLRDTFGDFARAHPIVLAVVGACLFGTGLAVFRRRRTIVALHRQRFERLYKRWVAEHGPPPGVIERQPVPPGPSDAEVDLGDYSFDRAVICDRARTVDLLLANNFHFENNCAILSIDGYPPGPFETVRAMLKRNPRLAVYALHDATPLGCRLARTLAQHPDWFAGRTTVIDVGIRPAQAEALGGPFLRGVDNVGDQPGLSAWEARWLRRRRLELAVIRPEQVVKRLFRAINQPLTLAPDADNVVYLPGREPAATSTATGDAGGGSDAPGMAAEADAADGSFDAFG